MYVEVNVYFIASFLINESIMEQLLEAELFLVSLTDCFISVQTSCSDNKGHMNEAVRLNSNL